VTFSRETVAVLLSAHIDSVLPDPNLRRSRRVGSGFTAALFLTAGAVLAAALLLF
jgi:hypothetical protein